MIVGLYLFTDWFSKTTGYVLGEDEKIKLAQCLNDKNSVFYYEENCINCYKQIEDFGEAISYISMFDCTNTDVCSNLRVLPAWEIDGSLHYGRLGLDELIELSGCDLEE